MLQPSTISYIQQLTNHNNKTWFEAHRQLFDNARNDFENLVNEIIEALGKADTDIAPLKAKNCIYRQYRDVRFSKDKTPYKQHMGASFDKEGKNSGYAGYYLHIEPGNKSLVGGGLWMPDAQRLKKVRQEIDYNFDEFESIISDKKFRKIYGALEAGEYKLTREPKGYEKDNPAIEYLKLKSVIAICSLTDNELVSEKLFYTIMQAFTALMPLIKFINRAME